MSGQRKSAPQPNGQSGRTALRRASQNGRQSKDLRVSQIGAALIVLCLLALGWLQQGEPSGRSGDAQPGPSRTTEADLQGRVTHVRDGDTIEVAGVPVRIANLDCAEMDTNEGQSARLFMVDLVRGQSLACDLEGRRSYDREVGTCAFAETGEDLGEILIGESICGRWRG